MRLALVTLGLALLCAAQPAPLRAQSTSTSTLTVEEIRHPRGSRTIPQRLAAERLLFGGIGTLVGTWLLNAAITAIASLGLYLEGTRPPCLPGLCGYEALFATPLIPLVGSAIWSGMIFESPPLGERWPATFGFLAMIGQHLGLAMIIAGAAELERPIDWGVSGFVSSEGAWLGTSGHF